MVKEGNSSILKKIKANAVVQYVNGAFLVFVATEAVSKHSSLKEAQWIASILNKEIA